MPPQLCKGQRTLPRLLGSFFFPHRNCLIPPGKAFPELKPGKQRKMQKPLESSQQMSYIGDGLQHSAQARPGQANAGLCPTHLPEACKTRTLDQHTEAPRAIENRETRFSKPSSKDLGTLLPDCRCQGSSHKGLGTLQEQPRKAECMPL